jgi:acetyltransferase-like isoleucine patch superfamily enzyme
VWTHMNYIGESVLGRNVALGGGTITGNLRLDESEVCSLVDGERISTGLTKFGNIIGDNCRIGVHVSTNPGIKIGAGSFVNNKVLVSADIPEKSFVTTKGGELSVRENRDAPGMPEERDVYRRAVTRDE